MTHEPASQPTKQHTAHSLSHIFDLNRFDCTWKHTYAVVRACVVFLSPVYCLSCHFLVCVSLCVCARLRVRICSFFLFSLNKISNKFNSIQFSLQLRREFICCFAWKNSLITETGNYNKLHRAVSKFQFDYNQFASSAWTQWKLQT